MRNQFVKLVENALKENPSMMKIGKKVDDMETDSTITFGFYSSHNRNSFIKKKNQMVPTDYSFNDLYSVTNTDNIVHKNGQPIEESFYEQKLKQIEKDIEDYELFTSMEALVSVPNVKQGGYHFNLVKHASLHTSISEYFNYYNESDVEALPEETPEEKFNAFSQIVHANSLYFNKVNDGPDSTLNRDGLVPAGRIFPSIQGISFYCPMEISNTVVASVFNILNLPDKEQYVIEFQSEPGKFAQRPYNRKKEVEPTNNREFGDTEVANMALAKLAQKKRMDDRIDKDARSKYHNYKNRPEGD